MRKSFTPEYIYPATEANYFSGEKVGSKILMDVKSADRSDYKSWWPCFFPITIGFLVTGSMEKPNVMTVSCMTVVNAHPFMVGFPVFSQGESPRGDGPRYSLEMIQNNPEFTLNVPLIGKEITTKAIICGSASGRDGINKIAKAKFTPLASRNVSPPVLEECFLNLECRVHSITPLGSHSWIIGRVETVHMDESMTNGERQLLWKNMPELLKKEK